MWSARSAVVTPRRSASVKRPPDNFSMARSMRTKSSLPCDQIFGRLAMDASAVRTSPHSSEATMMCFGSTISRQWASAAEVGVDQRNDGAHFGNAKPDRQVFGPVRHDEAHRLALAEVLLERPARISVGALVERAIGQTLVRR